MSTASCDTLRLVFNSVVIGLLCVIGLVGNVISLVVLRCDRHNRVAVFLLRSLAVVDSLMLVVSFVVLTVFYGFMPVTDPSTMLVGRPYLIRFIHPIGYMAESATVWLTVLLGVNRYLSICRPFLAGRMLSISGARVQVACVILVSIALNVPRIFQYEFDSANTTDVVMTTPRFPVSDTRLTTITAVAFDDVTVTLDATSSTSAHSFPLVRLSALGEHVVFNVFYTNALYTCLVLVLPLFILFVMNTKLIVELQKMRHRHRSNSLSSPRRRRGLVMQASSSMYRPAGGCTSSRENRETTVTVMIIIVLIACHTPDRIVQILKGVSADRSWTRCPHPIFYASNIANFLIVLNSSTNFVIYYAFRRRFRQNLWSILLCRETRRRNRGSMDSAAGGNSSGEMSAQSRRTSQSVGGGQPSLTSIPGVGGGRKLHDKLADRMYIIKSLQRNGRRTIFSDLLPSC